MGAETYWQVVTNPAHIGAELTWSIILDILLIQPIRWAVRRHDQRSHGADPRRLKRRQLKKELDDIIP